MPLCYHNLPLKAKINIHLTGLAKKGENVQFLEVWIWKIEKDDENLISILNETLDVLKVEGTRTKELFMADDRSRNIIRNKNDWNRPFWSNLCHSHCHHSTSKHS